MGNSGGAKAGALLVISAVIIAVGPMLTFITLEGPGGSESGTGYEIEEGSPYVLAAIVVGLMGLIMFAVKSGTGRKVLGGIALLGALFAAYAGYVDLTGVDDLVLEELGTGVDASSGLGNWVVLLGAVLAIIGSVMALAAPDETRPMAAGGPPPTAGSPPAGGPPPA